MDRFFRWMDTLLGAVFTAALVMGLLSALPSTAHAASEWTTPSGPVTAEPRAVGSFDAIGATGGINLRVRQGAEAAVNVHAEANLLPLIETVVETSGNGRTLVIRWKKGTHVNLSRAPTVEVTAVQLRAVSSAGSGDVVVEALKSPQLAVAIAGSGDVQLTSLTGEELTVKIAGSGDFKAAGQIERLKVSIAGSGDVRTDELQANDVSVSIAGSGDASVRAQKTLAVSIAGSGDVLYRGDAQVKSSIVGSGSVQRR